MNATASSLSYVHIDVFTSRPYAGNSVPVFLCHGDLNAAQMQTITREMRHFEAIFLSPTEDSRLFSARIFDLNEELPFAGHPVIGAAAALHASCSNSPTENWTFELAGRDVCVSTEKTLNGYTALLDQGAAIIGDNPEDRDRIASAFGLEAGDLDPTLPLEVISTGLCYLIVPVRTEALAKAHISSPIDGLVRTYGAQFAVLFDNSGLEIRHWNNDGRLEDIATGSAAGTIGAYRLRHCGAPSGKRFILHQGRFVGRPSKIEVEPFGSRDAVRSVRVGGGAVVIGRGTLEVRP